MLKQLAIEAHEVRQALEQTKKQVRISKSVTAAREALSKVIDPNGNIGYRIDVHSASEHTVRLLVGDLQFNVYPDGRVKLLELNDDDTLFTTYSVKDLADLGEALCKDGRSS